MSREKERRLGKNVLGSDPQDADIRVTCVHLLLEEFLEPRRQHPDVAVVALRPPYLGSELQLLGTVGQDPVRMEYFNLFSMNVSFMIEYTSSNSHVEKICH